MIVGAKLYNWKHTPDLAGSYNIMPCCVLVGGMLYSMKTTDLGVCTGKVLRAETIELALTKGPQIQSSEISGLGLIWKAMNPPV